MPTHCVGRLRFFVRKAAKCLLRQTDTDLSPAVFRMFLIENILTFFRGVKNEIEISDDGRVVRGRDDTRL